MLFNFMGSKNVGKNPNEIAMTWFMQSQNGDTIDQLALPFGVINLSQAQQGKMFTIDPSLNAGASQFGIAKRLRLTSIKPQSYYVTSGNCYVTGPTFVYIPTTNETLAFSPSYMNNTAQPLGLIPPGPQAFEMDNVLIDLNTSYNPTVQVFFFADNNSGVSVFPRSAIVATLYNF